MQDDIDKRFITDEWLDMHFPVEHKQGEELYRIKQHEIYFEFKNELNQQRRISGHSPLSDADLAIILDKYLKR